MAGTYQRKDHFYEKAKSEGYRSRAAYKLAELDKKFRFLRTGATVADLGCFPGGWLQVAAERVGSKGLVVGVDLNEVEPVSVQGKVQRAPLIIRGDLNDSEVRASVVAACGGKVDVVLSDMSPKLSGIRFRDAAYSADLVRLAFSFAQDVLAPGGAFVAKVFPGPESDQEALAVRKAFQKFSRENLDSSRKTSTEMYFVGQGFKS